MTRTGVCERWAIGSTIDEVRYVVRNSTIKSQSARRSCSAATAPSWASEMKPTSVTSASIRWKRSATYADDSLNCGSRSGNWGQ